MSARAAVAWDHDASRRSWHSYRNAGLQWVVAGLCCLLLVIVGGYVVVARSHALLAEGVPTVGTVRSASSEEVSVEYDADGQTYAKTLDIVSGRRYQPGEPVEVRYDATDPSSGRLVDEPDRLPGVGVVFAILALLALSATPIGLGVLWRARSWRSAMRVSPWTPARLRVRGRDIVLTPSLDEPIPARLLSTTRWRTKTVLQLDGQELWLLPVGSRDLLITADGTNTVYGLRRRG